MDSATFAMVVLQKSEECSAQAASGPRFLRLISKYVREAPPPMNDVDAIALIRLIMKAKRTLRRGVHRSASPDS